MSVVAVTRLTLLFLSILFSAQENAWSVTIFSRLSEKIRWNFYSSSNFFYLIYSWFALQTNLVNLICFSYFVFDCNSLLFDYSCDFNFSVIKCQHVVLKLQEFFCGVSEVILFHLTFKS